MKFYVFVYDPAEQAYFGVGEFDTYGAAAKQAALYAEDYTRPEEVKILVDVPELDTWREVRTQERSLQ